MKTDEEWSKCYNWNGQTGAQIQFQVRQIQADALRHAASIARKHEGHSIMAAGWIEREAEHLEAKVWRIRYEPHQAH